MKMKKTANRFVLSLLAALALLAAGCAGMGEVQVPPELPEVTYISPKNADGVQDELSVPVAAVSGELKRLKGYRLTVNDSEDTPVRVIEASLPGGLAALFGKKEVPEERILVWDGRGDNGEFVEDGEYRYQLEAWAGKDKLARTPLLTVVVDDTPPYVALSCAYTVFSPNNDGRRDSIAVNQRDSTSEELWSAEIRDAPGAAVKSFSLTGRLADFEWDGRDDAGALSPDGVYVYHVRSTDLAGNSAAYALEGITIDTRPSPIALDVDLRAFSPNGDGKKDLLRFSPKLARSQDVVSWQLEVVSEEGLTSRTLAGRGLPPGTVVFDGRDGGGRLLPDGSYLGLLSVLYGNDDNPKAASPGFMIDTAVPRAALSAPYLIFSPDGDGRKDTLTIHQATSVERLWTAEIVDAAGRPVKKASWQGALLEVTWDGNDDGGRRVPDGTYTYRVSSTDEADNARTIVLTGIRVDTRPTSVAVSPATRGFSPNGDGVLDNIILNLTLGQPEEIEAWSLSLVRGEGAPLEIFSGNESAPLPDRLTWNGRGKDDAIVEGEYRARLSVEYQKGNLAEAESVPFLLDVTPPRVSLQVAPRPFSPDADGVDDTLSIRLEAEDASPIDDWSLRILDPMEHEFIAFNGRILPAALTWDGRSRQGELVQSAEDYALTVSVWDSLRNAATAQAVVPVDVLVIREGDKLKIVISSIYFKPYTADYTDKEAITPERVEKNLKTLDRLAEILKKYQGYNIRLEGHAVMIYWDQPARAQAEQDEVLLPLSRKRAEVIREALITRGVRAVRMTTTGYGGLYPVVPHSDLDNRWKNRRVEFILVKEGAKQ